MSEPGVRITSRGVCVDPGTYAVWEDERLAGAKVRDLERREREVRDRPRVIELLTERCAQLEARAFFLEEAFAAAARLLAEKQEDLDLERSVLAAVLAEHRPTGELRRVA
jgi:predicted metal-dependent hydrolase